jgi:apolipoprotein N-acyltransferase
MTLSDAHGRIVAERRTIRGPGMLVGDLPTGRGGTVYSRTGDVVAQVMVAAWLGLLALLIWRRKRVSAGPSSPSPR